MFYQLRDGTGCDGVAWCMDTNSIASSFFFSRGILISLGGDTCTGSPMLCCVVLCYTMMNILCIRSGQCATDRHQRCAQWLDQHAPPTHAA